MQPNDPENDPRRRTAGGEGGAEPVQPAGEAEGVPSEAALAAAEASLRAALSRAGEDADVEPPPARVAFREALRARFVAGADAGAGEREVLGDAADEALRAWSPAPAATARERARAAFLGAGASEPTASGVAGETGPDHVSRRPVSRAAGAATRPRRARHAPAPAARMRLRLLAGGAAALAAAAALLLIARPAWLGLGDPTDPAEPAPAVAEVGWTLDLEGRDATEVLAAMVVDGAPVAGLAELAGRLESAVTVETLDVTVRLRRGEEFVMELGPGTEVGLARARGEAYRVTRGAARFATGPGFARGPLVVETPHVRTQVVGTVFGIDVGEDYSCVCCLEGEVWTEPLLEGRDGGSLGPASTRVLAESGPSFDRMPLVPGHAEPLRALAGYWG